MKIKLLSLSILLSLFSNSYAKEPVIENEEFFDDFYGSGEAIELATGVKTQIHKAPAVASVFTAQQIKNMGATNIDDVLESVPGLHIARSGNAYLPIYSFRGVYSTYNPQVLMLINGVPITTTFTGNRGQVWGDMPVEAISRIEVIRGPGSALYGADAFAGVINIITKNAQDIKNNEVSLRFGSNTTNDAWFTLGGESGELSYSAIVEYHKTDGANERVEADLQTIFDTLTGTNASYAPGRLSLGAENYDFRSEINYKNFTFRTGYQLRNNIGTGAGLVEVLDPSSNQKSQKFNYDFNYLHEFSDVFSVNLQATYFNTSQEIKNNYVIFPPGTTAGPVNNGVYTNGLIGNPEVWEKHQRYNSTFSYTGFSKHNIRFGFGYYESDLYRTKETKNFGLGPDGAIITPGSGLQDVTDTDFIFLKERKRSNRYLFIQDVWKFANDWELTAGLRHDDYSDFGTTTNPRLALVWSTTLNLSTKLLYGKAFRAPSFTDIGAINNPAAWGNPNIQPEEIETIELVFDYHPGDGFGAIANIYRYDWDDIIQYIGDENTGVSTAQNFGKQTAYGAEFEINYQLRENIKLAANFAWSNAENKTNKTDTPFVPKQQIYTQLDWKLSEEFHMHLRSHYIRDRKRNITDPREQIDNYWLTNFTFKWQLANYDIALIAKNIFNEDVREPSETGALYNDLPLSGRVMFGEVRYSF